MDENGAELTMRVKKSTTMTNMKTSYGLWSGLHPSVFCFSFDGVRIKDEDTIAGVGLEDHDMIEVEQRLDSGWKILGIEDGQEETSRHFVSPEGKEFNSLAAASKFISFGLRMAASSEKGETLHQRIPGVLKSDRLMRKSATGGSLRKTLFKCRRAGAR